jgi:hypothetical protein
MMGWLRLWHDMPTDPKWRTISRRSGVPIPTVIAIYTFVLVNASANCNARGTLCNWCNEDVAASLDIPEEQVISVLAEMQNRVLAENNLTGWEKRQPKREDSNSSQRVKEWREKQSDRFSNDKKRNETQRNAQDKTRSDKDSDKDSEQKQNGITPFPGTCSTEDPDEFSIWAETRYAQHPKKRNKFLAMQKLASRFAHDKSARAVFENNHNLYCQSEEWKEQGGRFVPALCNSDDSGFISDELWKFPPPRAQPHRLDRKAMESEKFRQRLLREAAEHERQAG